MKLLIAAALLALPGAVRAEDAFDRLTPLVGHWRGTSSEGRPLDISYRLIANGSALVETWRSPNGRETMTVYHRDGATTVATHYCAQGNQPTLAAEGQGTRLAFRVRSVANLRAPEASHLQSFWIEPEGRDRMRRSETYAEQGRTNEEGASLTRIAD